MVKVCTRPRCGAIGACRFSPALLYVYSRRIMTRNKNSNGGPDGPEDFADLARRFADLWQDQLSAMAADPALAKSVQESMALWQQATQGFPGGGPAAMSDPTAAFQNAAAAWAGILNPGPVSDEGRPEHEHSTAEAPPRTKTASDPSDGGERILHQLDRRLARIEERLDHLESGTGEGRVRADRGPDRKAAKKSSAKRASTRRGKPSK